MLDVGSSRGRLDLCLDLNYLAASDVPVRDTLDYWGETIGWDARCALEGDCIRCTFSIDPAFVDRLSPSREAALKAIWLAALRMSLATAAPLAGALLVHGAALQADPGVDAATLFVGESGAGKSTMAARLPEARCIADDTVLIWAEGGRWFVTGTPLRGREGRPTLVGRFALAEIVALRPHSPALTLAPLSAEAAFASLLRRVFYYPSPHVPAGGQAQVMALTEALVGAVPVRELASSLEHDIRGLWAGGRGRDV